MTHHVQASSLQMNETNAGCFWIWRQKQTKITVKHNKKIETGRFQGGVAHIYIYVYIYMYIYIYVYVYMYIYIYIILLKDMIKICYDILYNIYIYMMTEVSKVMELTMTYHSVMDNQGKVLSSNHWKTGAPGLSVLVPGSGLIPGVTGSCLKRGNAREAHSNTER